MVVAIAVTVAVALAGRGVAVAGPPWELDLDARSSARVLFEQAEPAVPPNRYTLAVHDGARVERYRFRVPEWNPVVSSPAERTTLTTDDVAARIRTTYLASMMGCVHAQPGRPARLVGRLVIDVGSDGRAEVSASGATPELARCVERAAKTWTFAIPRGADGVPRAALFAIPFEMTTDDAAPAPAPAPTKAAKPAPIVLEVTPAWPEPVVTITARELVVWSMDGHHGTLAAPLLRVDRSDPRALDRVRAALRTEVATDEPAARSIWIVVPSELALAELAHVMAAVRAGDDNAALFDDIALVRAI